jgi:diguanylate cyclase
MSTAQIAKATLHRLAQSRQEPTPENYARAWIEAGGTARSPDTDGQAWAKLVDQVVRGLEHGSRQWTAARKKESLQRVLDGSRSHPQRLLERLTQLVQHWQRDSTDAPAATLSGALSELAPATTPAAASEWKGLADSLGATVKAALPEGDQQSGELALELDRQAARWAHAGSDADLVRDVQATCIQARRLFIQRHHLVDELGRLVRSLTDGLTELAEDDSWARGQADALRARLEDGTLSVRGVRSASDLLEQTRIHQQRLRGERDRARAALRALVESLSTELAALGGQTGRFGDDLARCSEDLERSETREQMSSVLHQMLTASRVVQSEVADASARIASGRAQAETLNARVRELEGELRRLSDEATTDALTQVANRRGLALAFELEAARCAREATALTVGLIDIDNFKRLNDSLGHAVGDQALKALAAQVRAELRPADHVARFGGEEFVVLLPGVSSTEAQEVLTRLQRSLSMSLFMHEGREVFVTFSAGVTRWRDGEALEAAVERADTALYEAKRTGKNRTCVAPD